MFCSAATPRGVLGTAKLNTRSSKQQQIIRPAGCFPPVLDRRLSFSSSSLICLSFESFLLSISSPCTCPTTIFFSLLTRQSKWKHPPFNFCMHVNVLQCCHPSRRVGHCKIEHTFVKVETNDSTVEVLAQSHLFRSDAR